MSAYISLSYHSMVCNFIDDMTVVMKAIYITKTKAVSYTIMYEIIVCNFEKH